jgi:hypothetical protein
MSSRVNHLSVFVSAIVFFLLSYVWYSFLFGKMYAASMPAGASAMPASMTMPLIETFLLGWFLAYVIGTALSMRPDPNPATKGLGFGIFMGIGVYASMTLMGVVWGGLPFTVWAINAGFVVVAMAIMGWIIGAWSARGSATA